MIAGLFLVALSLLGSLQSVQKTTHVDEDLWSGRSRQFATGLVTGNPHLMTAFPADDVGTEKAVTMPGVTTMWVGTGVLLYECSFHDTAQAGLTSCLNEKGRPDRQSVHTVMAVINALLILAIWLLARRPFGVLAAGIGAVLIASEPFLAALNAMFHTDALVAYLSIIAYIALCRALSLFGKEQGRYLFAGLTGVSFALALLTKLTAVGLVPAAALCVGWALIKEWRVREMPRALGERIVSLLRSPPARQVFVATLAAIITFFALWPAMAMDPARQVGALRSSAHLAGLGHGQFFRGTYSTSPPWYFSFFTLGFRITPWAFLGLGLIPLPLLLRKVDRRWLVLAAFIASQALMLGLAAKKIDRYSATMMVAALLLIGVSFDLIFGGWARSKFRRASILWLAPIVLVMGTGLVLHTVRGGQRGFLYYNEALGGLRGAQSQVLVIWGGAAFEQQEWLNERYQGDSSRYVLCRASVWEDRLVCPPADPGQDRIYVQGLWDRQFGLTPISEKDKDRWERVGSYTVDGVEVLTYWSSRS